MSLFGKLKRGFKPFENSSDGVGPVSPEALVVLENLEKAGVQLTVRFSRSEAYTSSVLGLGRDGFFIDTLSPPSGDRHAKPGKLVEVESLIEGEKYLFRTTVVGKVEFLDELPAFKLKYPRELSTIHRRRAPRMLARGSSRLTFMRPFDCDARVVDIGEGGLAFEYPAELGKLLPGTRLDGARLYMGVYGSVELKCEIVGTLVNSLGGLSLPSSYRTGVRFLPMGESEHAKLSDYLKSLSP